MHGVIQLPGPITLQYRDTPLKLFQAIVMVNLRSHLTQDEIVNHVFVVADYSDQKCKQNTYPHFCPEDL